MTKILIADDHPSTIVAFKTMIDVFTEISPITFYECSSCETAVNAIQDKLLQK